MQLNSLHDVRLFVDLLDDSAEGAIEVGVDMVRHLLDRSNLEALSKKTLRRLVPDVNLDDYFPDQEHLQMHDVMQVLDMTRRSHFDRELLVQAVKEAVEEEEPGYHEEEVVEPGVVPVDDSPDESQVVAVHADEYGEDGKPVYRLDETPSEALVIHCGDPRFQKAFRRFVIEELGISNYTPVIIGGGVHAFGVQSLLPKNFKILWEQIKFFVKEGKLKQIIFINHEDCQWYRKMEGYRPKFDLPVIGRIDLRTAVEKMAEDFAKVKVRSFFAAIKDDEIVFEEVN